jgi:hypothetical protein
MSQIWGASETDIQPDNDIQLTLRYSNYARVGFDSWSGSHRRFGSLCIIIFIEARRTMQAF